VPGVEDLDREVVREALRLWGVTQPPAGRAQAVRLLREALAAPGSIRAALDRGPAGARDAFARLAATGAEPVDALLDRGWWGRGTLPHPLDWLQRRALVTPVDGLVHPVAEAATAFLDAIPADPSGTRLFAPDAVDPDPVDAVDGPAAAPFHTPDGGGSGLGAAAVAVAGDRNGGAQGGAEGVRVEAAGCVVVVASPEALGRVLNAPGAGLREVAPTVAISERSPAAVVAALRSAGVEPAGAPVPAAPEAPALPLVAEEAIGPRAVRTLLERAVEDGRQVRLRYFASSRGGAATDRVVDPWSFRDDLLRGWCHLRLGERTFAVDRIGLARLLPTAVEHQAPTHP
jgi:hypothetical protein